MPQPTRPTIAALYRYPVKGLSPQMLDSALLTAGEAMPLDRRYAIENGPGRFDPGRPKFLPKVNFLVLMRHERLAALKTTFDPEDDTLTILRDGKQVARGALGTRLGRQMIEQFFAGYMKEELKGPPRVVSAPGHSFTDIAAKCVHMVNLASVRDLERLVGRPLNPLRFRANVYFDGLDAWQERKWLDRHIAVGAAKLKVIALTQRCDATNVDPDSAVRDTAIPPTLIRTFGHSDLGFYAAVVEGGSLQPGDGIALL